MKSSGAEIVARSASCAANHSVIPVSSRTSAGYCAGEQRVQEHPVPQPVDPPRRVAVRGRVRGGVDRRRIQRDAVRALRRAQRFERQPVTEQQMVHGLQRVGTLGPSRRVLTVAVAEEGRAPRLVQRHPVLDHVRQRRVRDRRVVAEPLGRVAHEPAARVLERLRQVPVIERRVRRDAVLQARLGEPPVEVEAGRSWSRRSPPGRSAARRSRTGTPSGRGPPAAGCPRRTGGSGRRRRHRWCRRRSCRACARRCPRCSGRARPWRPLLPPGTTRSPRPRRIRVGKPFVTSSPWCALRAQYSLAPGRRLR